MNIDKIKMENDFVRARANDRWNSMTIMSYLDEYDEICKNEKGNVIFVQELAVFSLYRNIVVVLSALQYAT